MSAISYESYAGDRTTGNGRHIAVSVGGVRIAGAVLLRQPYSATDPDAVKWYVTLCIPGMDVRPTEVRDEAHARQWLAFLAGLSVWGHGAQDAEVEPTERITEANIADGAIGAAVLAEMDELAEEENDYWREVESCCGGGNFWCDHFRSYPHVAVADRW